MKIRRNIARASVLVLGLTLTLIDNSGCTLPRMGTQPETVCTVTELKPNVDYWDHRYQIKGSCRIDTTTINYDLHATWNRKGSGGKCPAKGKAAIELTAPFNCELFAVGDCLKDPLLYGGNCTNRLISTGKPPCPNNIPTTYYSAFVGGVIPDVLNASQKAELQARDQFPQIAPPIVIMPSDNFPPDRHYTDPAHVTVAFKLPTKYKDPKSWNVKFSVQKWNNETKHWHMRSWKFTDPAFLSSAKTFTTRTAFSLTDGMYRLEQAQLRYRESKCGYSWNSGMFDQMVTFWVGTGKRFDADVAGELNAQPPFKKPPTSARAPIKNPSRISTAAVAPPPVIQYPKDGQIFTEPATVIVRVQARPGQILVYELGSPRKDGSCAVQKKSTDGRFLSLGEGDYCLRVADKNQTNKADTVRFEVKPRLKTTPGGMRDGDRGGNDQNDTSKKKRSLPRR
jgi:hypothetical protein